MIIEYLALSMVTALHPFITCTGHGLLGAPGVNRTPDYGLQNRRFTTRTNGAQIYLLSSVLSSLKF